MQDGGRTSDLSRRDLVKAGAAGAVGLWLPFTPKAVAAATGRERNRASRRALRDLARRLRGDLLLPGNPNFIRARAPLNGRFDQIVPKAVAACAGEGDVVRCIEWCREFDVAPVVRAGGHSYAGYSVNRGLVIDIAGLNRVVVDRDQGTAVVGGGAANSDALAATIGGEWVMVGGTCLPVCVGGLTLGGGIGFNSRWAGLSADRLTGSRIITADGKRNEIDARHNPDLFWACRGGAGGNFGVNTELRISLAKIPVQDVAFYSFDWTGADAAAAVLKAYDEICVTAPAAFNSDTYAQATPVGEAGPRAAIEVASQGQYLGPMSELQEIVAPLLAAAPADSVKLESMPFWDMQRYFAEPAAPRHSWGDISRYATGPLPDSVYAELAELLAACPSRNSTENGAIWSLGWVGGPVVNSVGRTETAYVHRGEISTLIRATPDWELDSPKTVQHDLVGWSKQVIEAVTPHTPNESYQNFPNRSIKDWPDQYYGENFNRLVGVKTKYDPDNVFRNRQSIPVRKRG